MKNKVTFDREALELALAKAVKIVPNKITIPAFEYVKIVIENSTATITTCNNNSELTVRCGTKSKENFSFCAPAKLLHKIISMLKEVDVTISLSDKSDSFEIKCGKSKHKITISFQPDEFVQMPVNGPESEMVINEFYLKWGLNSACGFVSEDESGATSSINIEEKENKIVFQSTDKYVLFRAAIKPVSIIKFDSVNIYPDVAKNLCSLLGDEAEITVTHSKGQICFSNNEKSDSYFLLKSSVNNSIFPNTNTLFSMERDSSMLFNNTELKNALKRLRLHTEERAAPAFSIDSVEIGIEAMLKSTNALNGTDGEESVTILEQNGESMNKVFNSDGMQKCLNVIETEEALVSFSNKAKSTLITPANNKDTNNDVCLLIMERSV